MIPPCRRSVRAATAAVVSALTLAACGSSSDGADDAAGSALVEAPAGEPAAPASPEPAGGGEADGDRSALAVPQALRFTAPLVGGGELDATTLAARPTVFWFWAPT